MNGDDAATKELLSWRPKDFDDPVPEQVFDARMTLLNEEDAKKLKADFDSGRDPVAVYLWFGGDMFGNPGANASATMTRCAYVGADRETTMRLYTASGWSEGVRAEKIPEMLDEAMDFVAEFRKEMSMLNGCVPRAKPKAVRRQSYDDGKGGM